MKAKKFFMLAFSLATILFTSCGGDDNGGDTTVTGITLNKPTLDLYIGDAEKLIPSLQPAGSSATVAWTSDNPDVADVSKDGVVTAYGKGTATIAAAAGSFYATCTVNVTPKPVDTDAYPSLKGSNYYLIQMDELTYEQIKDKVVQDYRPDANLGKVIDVWSQGETYIAGTTSGKNFYDQHQGWLSFEVANAGWSGGGYNIGAAFGGIDMSDITNNPDDYYFHIALKSSKLGYSHRFIFYFDGTEDYLILGDVNYIDGANSFTPYANFTRTGLWNEFDIPMSYFTKKNANNKYKAQASGYVLGFMSGGRQGDTLDIDAVFFYKKAK